VVVQIGEMRNQGFKTRRVKLAGTRLGIQCHVIFHSCYLLAYMLRYALQRRLVLQFSLGTLGHALGKVLLVSPAAQSEGILIG